jgi:hypothetical protein
MRRGKETFMSKIRTMALHVQVATLMTLAAGAALADGGGLAVPMERMQTYTHKLQLSIEARNAALADFYLHELEGVAEHVAEHVPHYDDQPVGELTRQMLLPVIERLEETVDAREWADSDAGFLALVQACNGCHVATEHGVIRIAPATMNPFAQDFSVIED